MPFNDYLNEDYSYEVMKHCISLGSDEIFFRYKNKVYSLGISPFYENHRFLACETTGVCLKDEDVLTFFNHVYIEGQSLEDIWEEVYVY